MICDCSSSFAGKVAKMGVSEEDVMNIMGGMEHAEGIKLNDHKRKLKNRSGSGSIAFFQTYSLSGICPCLMGSTRLMHRVIQTFDMTACILIYLQLS